MKFVFVASLMSCSAVFSSVISDWSFLLGILNGINPLEVIIVLDGTQSTTLHDFEEQKHEAYALTNVINHIRTIGPLPDDSRIGLVQTGSSKDQMVKISLGGTQSFEYIEEEIRNLEYAPSSDGIGLGTGLQVVYNEFNDRPQRCRRLIWLVMDSRDESVVYPVHVAQQLKKYHDVTICAVAIGDPVEDIADKSMLKKISSSRCFFEFFSWKDYHDIIALVIENSSVGSN